jgi:hypothetical protein
MAATPSWEVAARSLPPAAVLARACAHTLARSGQSHLSAAELTGLLPRLDVPQGEAKVRALLRSPGCFTQVYHGRWQMGSQSIPGSGQLRAAGP